MAYFRDGNKNGNAYVPVSPEIYSIGEVLMREAGLSVKRMLRDYGRDSWSALTFSEKAAICTLLVRALLDKRKVANFLNKDTKHLV